MTPGPSEVFDYVVVGSGLAGLSFALHAAEHGSVCVLTKAAITESNTNYAQGGIAAAVGESDGWELHEADTLKAGAGLCDPEAVRFLVQRAPAAIEWLRQHGARFDPELGREGGHSRRRIVHHRDRTGWEVERAVSSSVRAHPGITVFEDAFVTRLEVFDGRCAGVAAHVADLGPRAFAARAVLLATGGCGRVYSQTTNPRVATGDGIALADAVGAEIRGMEFMQFHPTALSHEQHRNFLITEALRGAGATLRNHQGRRFMRDYDPRLELAPRDVVARSIVREMERLKTWCVYLDAAHLEPSLLQQEFPTIWSVLREVGIEMESDWIPVVPAQHYSCGGVVTDLSGRTTVPGLYASGEVSSTGVHGANRLASNSLLEALVFSAAAAEAVRDEPEPRARVSGGPSAASVAENEAVRLRKALQAEMSRHAGVFRTDAGLAQAAATIVQLRTELEELPRSSFAPYSAETENLLCVAHHVVDSARRRRENVGLHFNADLEPTAASPASAAPSGRNDP